MLETDAATYKYEYRGTMEIPMSVLEQHRGGSLALALQICDEYGCQILLRDPGDASSVRGWVKPDGRYALT